MKVVSAMSAGVDAHDLVELKSRGIRLGHTPGVLTDSVVRIVFHLSPVLKIYFRKLKSARFFSLEIVSKHVFYN